MVMIETAEEIHDKFYGIHNKQRYDICELIRRYSDSENKLLLEELERLKEVIKDQDKLIKIFSNLY